ncbi:hypothetical protein E2C01_041307 [Portunus trituberculatus]|uniref:Uncharacterized protein n=1 Tax=Portunus trituberculatus TaxID=210409 RepID=A0A5B7FQD4_PORTR|nr:hypothetical protein [Portunus trituberculatus]
MVVVVVMVVVVERIGDGTNDMLFGYGGVNRIRRQGMGVDLQRETDTGSDGTSGGTDRQTEGARLIPRQRPRHSSPHRRPSAVPTSSFFRLFNAFVFILPLYSLTVM